jgi:hypothetical protein
MLGGATALTVAFGYGAYATVFPDPCRFVACDSPGPQAEELRQTAFIVGGGVIAILGAMMWFAWTQPDDERPPYFPGTTSVATGIAEIGGGALRMLFAPPVEPDRTHQFVSCAIITGSGLVDLVAGIAWFIWAHR